MEIHIPNSADDSASSPEPTVARRGASEAEWKHIQNVIRAKDEKIARLENLIQQLECKVDELAKKIAFYESPNMASSTPSYMLRSKVF